MRPRPALLALALLAAAWFGPWPSQAYMFARKSPAMFDPAFSLEEFRPTAGGVRPGPGAPPVPVVVEILPLPGRVPAHTLDAVLQAVANWDGLPGSALSVSAVAPATGAPYDPNWLDRYANPDGRSTIEFVIADWDLVWTPAAIGYTIAHLGPNGAILEADVFLNAQDFTWRVFQHDGFFPGLVAARVVDVEAIVTHELGHVFAIGHSQKTSASMYDHPGLADTRARRLTVDDLAAIRMMYPIAAADRPGPSLWRVAENGFSDGACGQTYLTLLGLPTYYPTNLVATHPPGGDIPFCLFGAGFSSPLLVSIDLERDGLALSRVINDAYVGPNFVKGVVSNPAGLDVGAYDFSVVHLDGASSDLAEGLILNPATNQLPIAAIQPSDDYVSPGASVRLDGSGSTDPEGAPLTYKWELAESPIGSAGLLTDADQPAAWLELPGPGLYVVRLVVNDGVSDGVADQVTIRAERAYPVSRKKDDPEPPFCCLGSVDPARAALAPRPSPSALAALVVLFAPVLVLAAVRVARRRGRS